MKITKPKCKHEYVSTPAVKIKVCLKCGQMK